MSGLLHGKWALVTGAGRGIGRAIALALAGEGAHLALVARSKAQIENVADQCLTAGASGAVTVSADLSEAAQVEQMSKSVLSHAGHVEVLVNNAGRMVSGNAVDGNADEWERMFALNVHCPMRLTRLIAPGMVARQSGTIINVGSVSGVEPMKQGGAYAATKWALRGWSLSCYERLRNENVKVMLINPAFVRTSMTERIPGVLAERMLTPDDVAEAALLALQTSSMCCPQEITLRLTRSAYKAAGA